MVNLDHLGANGPITKDANRDTILSGARRLPGPVLGKRDSNVKVITPLNPHHANTSSVCPLTHEKVESTTKSIIIINSNNKTYV